MASEETILYCICRKPYDKNEFMIECEICKDWFHGSCVQIKEHQASDIETYHCPNCQINHGPLVLKRKRNVHRHDYSEDRTANKPVQTGTSKFIRELKSRTFPLCHEDNDNLIRLRGYELTTEYLEEHGFNVPIIVERPAGLDLVVPPPSFSIQDVENHVGSMREIDVIDVARQEDYKMLMREWTEYYNRPHRSKTYNVISLEFSNTKLADLVIPPRVVRELSWVNSYWPEQVPDDVIHIRPEVVRYCLMGVKDSFTDFHIDFGGTSVWYHVLRGEKIFYMIPPTSANLLLYEHWVASSSQGELFFGDQVEDCYKLVIKQGQTVFIPTGWIHGVFTPIDSLVFGGNFLHSLNVQLQIQIFDMEKRVQTNNKYMFPNYETMNWYAAKNILEGVKEYSEDGRKPPGHLVEGLHSLLAALKLWTQKKDYNYKDVPETIQCGKLLNEIAKEVKKHHHQIKSKKKSKSERKKEKKSSAMTLTLTDEEDSIDNNNSGDDSDYQVERKAKKKEKHKTKSKTEKKKSKSEKRKEKQEKKKGRSKKRGTKHKVKEKNIEVKSEEEDEDDKAQLTVRISKHRNSASSADIDSDYKQDMSVFDFKDDPDMKTSVKLSPKRSPKPSPIRSPRAVDHSPPAMPLAGMNKAFGIAHISARNQQTGNQSPDFTPQSPTSYHTKRRPSATGDSSASSTPLSSPMSSPRHNLSPGSSSGRHSLSSPGLSPRGSLLGSPPSGGGMLQSPSWASGAANSGLLGDAPMSSTLGLKLRLSNGKIVSRSTVKGSRPQNSIGADRSDDSDSDLIVDDVPKSRGKHKGSFEDVDDRMNMPEIRGGLNGSIADILEASGYGTETDFKVDEDIGSASPNMRDAIQGMLSMSQMGGGLTLSANNPSPFEHKQKSSYRRQPSAQQQHLQHANNTQHPHAKKRKLHQDSDDVVYKDEHYAYTSLTLSDNEEEHIFKPRGKSGQDDNWKPKAKLTPNCPKPDRVAREGATKESMESVLAASAAKLEHSSQYTQPTKRPYKRKQSQDDYSNSTPGTSSSSGTNATKSAAPKAKKAKKGQATVKQRLGKILKLHKMMR